LGSAVQDAWKNKGVASLAIGASLDARLGAMLGALLGVLVNSAHAGAMFPEATFDNWRGELEQRVLPDGSMLNEYVSSSQALEGGVIVRVGFVPRFKCRPVFGFRFTGAQAAAIAEIHKDGSSVTLAIDQESMEVPLMVDVAAASTTLWLHLAGDIQSEVLGKFDVGSNARLDLSDGAEFSFSLIGSRRSGQVTRELCLRHEPEP